LGTKNGSPLDISELLPASDLRLCRLASHLEGVVVEVVVGVHDIDSLRFTGCNEGVKELSRVFSFGLLLAWMVSAFFSVSTS
jgi:hypothetical protein